MSSYYEMIQILDIYSSDIIPIFKYIYKKWSIQVRVLVQFLIEYLFFSKALLHTLSLIIKSSFYDIFIY